MMNVQSVCLLLALSWLSVLLVPVQALVLTQNSTATSYYIRSPYYTWGVTDFDVTGKAVVSEPADACSTLTRNFSNLVLWIEPHGCSISDKILNCQQAGCVGAVTASDYQIPGEEMVADWDGSQHAALQVPFVSVGSDDAVKIRQILLISTVIQIIGNLFSVEPFLTSHQSLQSIHSSSLHLLSSLNAASPASMQHDARWHTLRTAITESDFSHHFQHLHPAFHSPASVPSAASYHVSSLDAINPLTLPLAVHLTSYDNNNVWLEAFNSIYFIVFFQVLLSLCNLGIAIVGSLKLRHYIQIRKVDPSRQYSLVPLVCLAIIIASSLERLCYCAVDPLGARQLLTRGVRHWLATATVSWTCIGTLLLIFFWSDALAKHHRSSDIQFLDRMKYPFWISLVLLAVIDNLFTALDALYITDSMVLPAVELVYSGIALLIVIALFVTSYRVVRRFREITRRRLSFQHNEVDAGGDDYSVAYITDEPKYHHYQAEDENILEINTDKALTEPQPPNDVVAVTMKVKQPPAVDVAVDDQMQSLQYISAAQRIATKIRRYHIGKHMLGVLPPAVTSKMPVSAPTLAAPEVGTMAAGVAQPEVSIAVCPLSQNERRLVAMTSKAFDNALDNVAILEAPHQEYLYQDLARRQAASSPTPMSPLPAATPSPECSPLPPLPSDHHEFALPPPPMHALVPDKSAQLAEPAAANAIAMNQIRRASRRKIVRMLWHVGIMALGMLGYIIVTATSPIAELWLTTPTQTIIRDFAMIASLCVVQAAQVAAF